MTHASYKNNHLYNKELKTYARSLRANMTKSEACLWKFALKGRKLKGYQFRRQRPVLNYIADFMCIELNFIIEVDGITHAHEDRANGDIVRQKKLEEAGFVVVRLTDDEVLKSIDNVAVYLEDIVDRIKNPPPTPASGGQ